MLRWRIATALALACIVTLAVTGVFAFRVHRLVRSFHTAPAEIRPWMTIPFIAHSHHVPAAPLFRAIGITPEPNERRSIRRLAHELHVPERQLIWQVQDALDKDAFDKDKPPQ